MSARQLTPLTAAQQQLVTATYAQAKTIALRWSHRLPASVDFDDLISAAAEGLVQAARDFDDSRGVPFAGYAVPRIKGAILDHLRRSDPISRRSRENMREGKAAPEEVAIGLHLNNPVLLDGDSGVELASPHPSPAEQAERNALQAQLRQAVTLLPERERAVLTAHLRGTTTYRALGVEYGVTESRICQILRSAERQLTKIMHKRVSKEINMSQVIWGAKGSQAVEQWQERKRAEVAQAVDAQAQVVEPSKLHGLSRAAATAAGPKRFCAREGCGVPIVRYNKSGVCSFCTLCLRFDHPRRGEYAHADTRAPSERSQRQRRKAAAKTARAAQAAAPVATPATPATPVTPPLRLQPPPKPQARTQSLATHDAALWTELAALKHQVAELHDARRQPKPKPKVSELVTYVQNRREKLRTQIEKLTVEADKLDEELVVLEMLQAILAS